MKIEVIWKNQLLTNLVCSRTLSRNLFLIKICGKSLYKLILPPTVDAEQRSLLILSQKDLNGILLYCTHSLTHSLVELSKTASLYGSVSHFSSFCGIVSIRQLIQCIFERKLRFSL